MKNMEVMILSMMAENNIAFSAASQIVELIKKCFRDVAHTSVFSSFLTILDYHHWLLSRSKHSTLESEGPGSESCIRWMLSSWERL